MEQRFQISARSSESRDPDRRSQSSDDSRQIPFLPADVDALDQPQRRHKSRFVSLNLEVVQ